MRHDLTTRGWGLELRPVTEADAAFIHDLRADPGLGRFLHRGATTIEEQRTWIDRYLEREDDLYFVIAGRSGESIGTVGLYAIDRSEGSAEWGRWVLRPGSAAAAGSALLLYQVAFEDLGLGSVYCRTLDENRSVVAFHDHCGLERRTVIPDPSGAGQVIEHALDVHAWPTVKGRLVRTATAAQALLER